MKVFLLHRSRDFVVRPELRDEIFDAMLSGNLYAIAHAKGERGRRGRAGGSTTAPRSDEITSRDLELDTIWREMAAGDDFLFEVAKRGVLSSLGAPDDITYRQRVLADCLEQAETVRALYNLAIEALACERKVGGLWGGARPSYILTRSVHLLWLYVDILRQVRQIADERSQHFSSEGFTRFFAVIREELTDDYFATLEEHLRMLELKHGVLESAQLSRGDKGRRYVFHRPPEQQSWRDRLPFRNREPNYTFELHPRDEAGARALEEIRTRAINHVADAAGQAADHIQSFFTMLRLELAFYLGCVNLHEALLAKSESVCFPEPLRSGERAFAAEGLYDPCLTLHVRERVVGNELDADGKSLVMITGANQGGKSTLLRSVGLAQLMMQAGMFVAARSFRASTVSGVFTHYKHEEDTTMERGKLDEELRRMSAIIDEIRPGALLLCNESFASTNEREGSEIARHVVHAMLDSRVTVFFVTHMYDLAHRLELAQRGTALFLRATPDPNGRRTFKLLEGLPLPTSHGTDSYRRIFGDFDAAAATASNTGA